MRVDLIRLVELRVRLVELLFSLGGRGGRLSSLFSSSGFPFCSGYAEEHSEILTNLKNVGFIKCIIWYGFTIGPELQKLSFYKFLFLFFKTLKDVYERLQYSMETGSVYK